MQGNCAQPGKNYLKEWKVAVPRTHTEPEILPVPTSQTGKSHGSRLLGGVYRRVLPQECGIIKLRLSTKSSPD